MLPSVNLVILRGVLTRPAERRALPGGDTLTSFEVTTRDVTGASTVPVTWAGAPPGFEGLEPGTALVVTGRVRRRFFRSGGTTQSRTEVVADAVLASPDARRARRALDKALVVLGP